MQAFNIAHKVSEHHIRQCFKHDKGIDLAWLRFNTTPDSNTEYDSDNYIDAETTPEASEYVFRLCTRSSAMLCTYTSLVVKDDMKEIGSLRKFIAKVYTIVSHTRKSTHATFLLDKNNRLQAANATRWN